MKTKITAALIAATMTLGLASCAGNIAETTELEMPSSESETEEETTTTEESTEQTTVAVKKLDMSLEDVSDALFEVYTGQKGNCEPSEDGDILGGTGMWGGVNYWSWTVFELNTDSELYQNLKVGDTVSYTSVSGNPNEFVVCAINGQYVLQIAEPVDDTNWNNLAPFNSISEAQAVYDTFVELE